MNVNDIYSILIAVGIILGLVVICVIFALYLMKNKIYSSSDKHFDKPKDENKKEIKESFSANEHLSTKRDKYLKSKKTVKISEVEKAFRKKYPLCNINVKYAFMKLVTISQTKNAPHIKLKKISKTFHITIKNALDMRYCLRYTSQNIGDKYNISIMSDLVRTTIELLTVKIVPKDDKDFWDNIKTNIANRW